MIHFACGQCGRKYQVKDEIMGKKRKCPCGNSIVVPAATLDPVPPLGLSDPSTSEPLEIEAHANEGNGKHPICGILAAIFGGAALLLAVLGCLMYLIIWVSLPNHEKIGIVAGVNSPSSGKVLLPIILNYFSLLAALAAIVLGIFSICIEKPTMPGIAGIVNASTALVILFAFWIWSVSRRWESYAPDMREPRDARIWHTDAPLAIESGDADAKKVLNRLKGK
jgi:hypothetical protein